MAGTSEPQRQLWVSHFSDRDHLTGITQAVGSLLVELAQDPRLVVRMFTNVRASAFPDGRYPTGVEVTHWRAPKNLALAVAANSLRLRRRSRSVRPDWILCSSPFGVVAQRASVAVFLHDLYPLTNPELFSQRKRMLWRAVVDRVLRKANVVFAISQSTADAARREFRLSRRIEVVHLGTKFSGQIGAIHTDGPLSADEYGLMVCTVTPNKSVETVFAALELLAADGRSVRVLHVGRDEFGILRAASACFPAAQVRALGQLSDDELFSLMSNASFFVNSSVAEGFCMPVIDAQALRIPVICSDIPVLREVAGDGAVFVGPGDKRGYATAIERLLDDRGYRSRVVAAGGANAHRYRWDAAAETVARHLRSI